MNLGSIPSESISAMRYRLEKTDLMLQKIWDDKENRMLIAFTPADFSLSFSVTEPERIVNILNKQKADTWDYRTAIESLVSLCNTKDKTHNSLIDTINGLKEGGHALNFVLPKPVKDNKDCITDTELYATQYSLAKKQWSAYYSRFYEKRANENDYLVQRCHRNDLHHLRCLDGKWWVKVTIRGQTHREYVGDDEEEAKTKRDQFLQKLGFKYE